MHKKRVEYRLELYLRQHNLLMSTKIFSFFSGAGFLDLGFENSGYDVVFANEIIGDFAKGYRYSRKMMGKEPPKYGLCEGDIRDFLSAPQKNALLKKQVYAEKELGDLVGFIGGPPCPDFSVAGKNRGAEGKHGVLSQVYMDLICDVSPDFFLFENVKGLWRTSKHRVFFDHLVEQAEKSGYCVSYRLVNALEYGAPQDRDRILLFGVKSNLLPKGESSKFMNLFPWESEGWISLSQIKAMPWPSASGEALLRCPSDCDIRLTVSHWFEKNDVENHPNAKDYFKPKAALEKMKYIVEGDVSRKAYKRLHRWRYSPTVAYGNNEVHWHPWLQRRISVAEALALQSLPKEYILPPDITLSAKFKTIGNGVPYCLAFSIAKCINIFLNNLT